MTSRRSLKQVQHYVNKLSAALQCTMLTVGNKTNTSKNQNKLEHSKGIFPTHECVLFSAKKKQKQNPSCEKLRLCTTCGNLLVWCGLAAARYNRRLCLFLSHTIAVLPSIAAKRKNVSKSKFHASHKQNLVNKVLCKKLTIGPNCHLQPQIQTSSLILERWREFVQPRVVVLIWLGQAFGSQSPC